MKSIGIYVVESIPMIASQLQDTVGKHYSVVPVNSVHQLLPTVIAQKTITPAIVILATNALLSDVAQIKIQLNYVDIVWAQPVGSLDHIVALIRESVWDIWLHPIDWSVKIDQIERRLSKSVDHEPYSRYAVRQGILDSYLAACMENYIAYIGRRDRLLTIGAASFDEQIRWAMGGQRPEVLVVDDEPGIIKLVSSELEANYTVIAARDGFEALDAIDHHPKIGVILLDVQLPRLSGDVLLPKLRARLPESEIIMMTAFSDIAPAIQTMQAGVIDYLRKPIEIQVLASRVTYAFRVKWIKQSENFDLPFDIRIGLLRRYQAASNGIGITVGDICYFLHEFRDKIGLPDSTLVTSQQVFEWISGNK